MGRNDMNHMQHLESVALSDCAVLETKEGTYQGSWKRAGGRSAWFMARRNMDRMLTMMPAKPVNHEISNFENIRGTLMSLKQSVHYNFAPLNQTAAPLPGTIEGTMAVLEHVLDSYTADDIFARIAKNPKGEDGTVLACMRDLRRYFVLVEAEMIAEGVVEPESKTYESDTYPQDIYTLIANETGLDREEVKRRCHEACYSKTIDPPIVLDTFDPLLPITPIQYTAPKATVHIRVSGCDSASYVFPSATNVVVTMGEEIIVELEKGEFTPDFLVRPPLPASNGGYAREQAARHRETQPTKELDLNAPIISEGNVYEGERPVRKATAEDYALANSKPSALSTMRPIGTPEDGGHHASVVPWEIDGAYWNLLIKRVGATVVDAFYSMRTANVFRLEPVVSGDNRCPREISDCYEWWTREVKTDDVTMRINNWVMRRDRVPAELADQFPRLQREMNTVEFEQSMRTYRFMYAYAREKWILMPEFEAWAQES